MIQLATRALVRACCSVAALLTLLVVVLSVLHQHDLLRERDRHDMASVAEALAMSANPDAVRAALNRTEAGRLGRLRVRFDRGEVLGGLNGDPSAELSVRTADGSGATVSLVASPVAVPFTEIALTLVIAASGVACAVLIGVRPLRSVARALAALAEVAADGRVRVRLDGPSELVALAEAINANADHTDRLLAKEREMVADVSHRLRTPLTALRLDADAIGSSPAADRVRSCVESLERDVDRIIHAFDREPTEVSAATSDLAAAVAERMVFWSEHASTQGRACEVALPDEPVPVPLARDEVDAVVDTLLANIFQHTPPTTPFAVTVVRHAGWVTLVVEDGGPGFADPSAALRRGLSGSGSTGLGLDIARSAVEATGGHIVIDKGILGGARVRLRLSESDNEYVHGDPRAWRLWSKTTTERSSRQAVQ